MTEQTREPAVGFEPTTDGLQICKAVTRPEMAQNLPLSIRRDMEQGHLVGEFLRVYEATALLNRRLSVAYKKYIRESVLYIKRTWPTLESSPVASITAMDCLQWAARLHYCASRFNGIIAALKGAFRLAVAQGAIAGNPADAIQAMPVRIRPPKLPTRELFLATLRALECSPWARRSVKFVKFLAYSGFRINEARRVVGEDVTEHGIRVTGKNGDTEFVPILPEMRALLDTLPAKGPLFKIKNPRRALQNACRRVGIVPLTNHQLRHIFATRCIECGVDVKTVSAWLRHKDGGALALKRYSHVRDEHSMAMAAKVRF